MSKKFLAAMIGCIIIATNSIIFANAAGCNPQIKDYTIKNNVNTQISRIEQGETAKISVDIEDSYINTGSISASDISVVGADGSFGSLETDSVNVTSTSGIAKYTIAFKEATYSGSGTTISFKIKYGNLNITSDKIILDIYECSQKDTQSEENNTSTSRQPYIEIDRGEIPHAIKENEEFSVKLLVKNRGSAEMKHPVMTISQPTSLSLADGMSNIHLPDIKAGTSRYVTLKFKGADYIQASSEEVDISLSYDYNSGTGELTQGIYTDKIIVPMQKTKKSSIPIIQITRGTLETPIGENKEFSLPIKIKNLSDTAVTSAVVTFTFPEELIPLDDSTMLELSELNAGQEAARTLRLKAKNGLTASSQEITADIKYNYISENESASGNDSVKISVPTVPSESGLEPLIQITVDTAEGALNGGERFSAAVTINNVGSTDIKAGVLSWDSGEGIILTNKSSSVNVGAIKAGAGKTIALKGKTVEKLTTASQTISGEFKYKYNNGKELAGGTENVKVVLSTVPTDDETKTAVAAPNIIVSKYNYGGVPIANGSKFTFDVSFKNTSKAVNIENIVMSLDTGDGLSIRQASNTYYYDKLSPQAAESQSIDMQVLPSAESGSVKLTLNFTFEYIDNKERKQVTSAQSVSIPVYKPDKLEITLEPLAAATVGQEQTVTLNYVNKGKGQLSNVKAEIEGDVNALTSVQNLGNFESGKSGTISFVVVPENEGKAEFTVRVSYEDANSEQKTLEFPCTMDVEPYVEEDFSMDDEPEEEPNSHKGIIIGSAVGGVAVLAIIAFIIVRKRKKKSKASISVDWGTDDENRGLN